MGRYLRVYASFFKSAFRRELEFRANFIAKLFVAASWVFFFSLVLVVIYRNTDDVAGWSAGEATVLSGVIYMAASLCQALFFSLIEIPEQVRKGSLDFIVTKPIDTQFWVSTRRFNFDQFGAILAGMGMTGIGINLAKLSPSVLDWVAFLILLGVSITLIYCLSLLLMTMGLYFVRVDNLWVLGETATYSARYPVSIYSRVLQNVLTFWVPFAFLGTFPAKQLTEGADWAMVGVGLLWAGAFFAVTRAFWLRAQRSYASASS